LDTASLPALTLSPFIVVKIQVEVFWVVTPCSFASG